VGLKSMAMAFYAFFSGQIQQIFSGVKKSQRFAITTV
jgi:hypothetical protein